ncbi:MAG: hypothetical protein NTV94_07460 [Planctomycetota bacterium]|nr:hypothetical protein [Planctomycetota bacterium]
MLTVTLLSSAFLVLAMITIKAWWGDGRTDLRRCPKCWYDLSSTKLKSCSEYGYEAHSEAVLFQRRGSTRITRIGLIGMGVILIAIIVTLRPGPWTVKTPRPLMKLLLAIAASPPAPPRGGSGLPVPTAALMTSRSPWDRIVWQHQTSIAFQGWSDALQASTGPITDAELARLVPLADEANALFAQTGGLFAIEAWGCDAVIEQMVARRAAASDNTHQLLRAQWTLAELQYIGAGYSWRPDFARIPDAIIEQALAHADAKVRLFGLDRFGRRVHQVVMEPTSPMPPGRELVESMATTNLDAAVRKRAADLTAYMDGFMSRK